MESTTSPPDSGAPRGSPGLLEFKPRRVLLRLGFDFLPFLALFSVCFVGSPRYLGASCTGT
jgi:hypothetical protein